MRAAVLATDQTNEFHEHIIDGARLAKDLDEATNRLEAEGYAIVSITPVLSGRYNWDEYSRLHGHPSTAVSWGYSVTEGVMVTAKQR